MAVQKLVRSEASGVDLIQCRVACVQKRAISDVLGHPIQKSNVHAVDRLEVWQRQLSCAMECCTYGVVVGKLEDVILTTAG